MTCFWRDVVNAKANCEANYYYLPVSENAVYYWANWSASYEHVLISLWDDYDADYAVINHHLTWFDVNSGDVIEDKILTDNQSLTVYFTETCIISSTVYGNTSTDADIYIYDVNTRARLTPTLSAAYRNAISRYGSYSGVSYKQSNYKFIVGDHSDPANVTLYQYEPTTGALLDSHNFGTIGAFAYGITLSSDKFVLELQAGGAYTTHIGDLSAGTLTPTTGTTARVISNMGAVSNGDTIFSYKVNNGTSTAYPYEIIDVATNTVLSTGAFGGSFTKQWSTAQNVRAFKDGFIYYADEIATTGHGTIVVTDKYFNAIRTIETQRISKYRYWNGDGTHWNYNSPVIVGSSPVDGIAWEIGDVLVGIPIV